MSLLPGQRVCFSGRFLTARTELAARARRAGLLVDGAVTAATDLLVANDAGSGSASVRAAIAAGVPVLDEYSFDDLLAARA
ncbi:hypothetical protein GTQ99_14920 [Kineococcus sp. T13]|uniref:BRCT domain-containing protein n=1 Tax=Kineococcus vitellinus TaxID=2696565 RepID=UPI0014136AB3|nr:hypothetical protein [Kineococcus vitellinus]